MNLKEAKKFRKQIRKALKDGLTPEMVDAAAAQVMRLEIDIDHLKRENQALCDVISAMQDQMHKETKSEYDQMPEVLK